MYAKYSKDINEYKSHAVKIQTKIKYLLQLITPPHLFSHKIAT